MFPMFYLYLLMDMFWQGTFYFSRCFFPCHFWPSHFNTNNNCKTWKSPLGKNLQSTSARHLISFSLIRISDQSEDTDKTKFTE